MTPQLPSPERVDWEAEARSAHVALQEQIKRTDALTVEVERLKKQYAVFRNQFVDSEQANARLRAEVDHLTEVLRATQRGEA